MATAIIEPGTYIAARYRPAVGHTVRYAGVEGIIACVIDCHEDDEPMALISWADGDLEAYEASHLEEDGAAAWELVD